MSNKKMGARAETKEIVTKREKKEKTEIDISVATLVSNVCSSGFSKVLLHLIGYLELHVILGTREVWQDLLLLCFVMVLLRRVVSELHVIRRLVSDFNVRYQVVICLRTLSLYFNYLFNLIPLQLRREI